MQEPCESFRKRNIGLKIGLVPRSARKWAIRQRPVANFSAESYNAVMAQMNISLPDALKNWAEGRVAEGRYSSTSDYVRDLMRRDQDYAEKLARLQAAIDEGLASEETDATIESIIADGRTRRRTA